MASIIGFAVPLATAMPGINQNADHTYVRTADGRGVWGCWGRSSGGREVCRGTGSSKRADCHSQPWGTSGIIYGVTGVCHQTANRILYPAGAIVSGAHGYWLSSLVYGTYGKDPLVWGAQLLRCYWTSGDKSVKATIKATPAPKTKAIAFAPPNKENIAYTKQILALYKKVVESPEPYSLKKSSGATLLNKELAIAMEIKLKASLGSANKDSAIQIQRNLHLGTDKLVDTLYSESISPAEYATKMNDLCNKQFRAMKKELGKTNYEKLFGISADVNLILVNPKVMATPKKRIG